MAYHHAMPTMPTIDDAVLPCALGDECDGTEACQPLCTRSRLQSR